MAFRMAAAIAVAIALPGVACGYLKVVAGGSFWDSIAVQVGGDHAKVTSIVASWAADPHLRESDAANAIAVDEAGLVIVNGAGYDDPCPQLLGATRNSGRVVVTVQAVLGARGPDVNPHFWYDIHRSAQGGGRGYRGRAGVPGAG